MVASRQGMLKNLAPEMTTPIPDDVTHFRHCEPAKQSRILIIKSLLNNVIGRNTFRRKA